MNNLKLIQLSPTHYVVVDDSEIKEGDFVYESNIKQIFQIHKHGLPNYNPDRNKITHSTQPLYDKPHYATYKMLTVGHVEEAIFGYSVEKMAENKVTDCKDLPIGLYRSIWKGGFKAHQELSKDKLFTIEDIKKAFKAGADWQEGGTILYPDEYGYIKSLLPKTEWNVTFDEQGKLKTI
jgi:hypothetical protein